MMVESRGLGDGRAAPMLRLREVYGGRGAQLWPGCWARASHTTAFGDGDPFEPERDAAFLRKFAARGLHERLQRSERAPPPMRSS
jgi:hypothetical protein